jgi:DNA-binding phage protein
MGETNMTAQAKAKRQHTISHRKILIRNNHDYSKEVKLFKIAAQMEKVKLPNIFIVTAIKTALEFEGIADLLSLWSEEDEKNEKEEIISDIQDMIDACNQKETSEEIYVKFNDLDAIANNVRAFKDSLYQKVMGHGGISKLAEQTGIPQPSLSRFFNSNAMPRRATVLKIAKALNLDEIKIDILWCR